MKTISTLILTLLLIPFAKAQTACDSLDIKVAYHPFYDSLIEVNVENHAQKFYNYPGFIVYNSNGDTMAKETVNLFGIGTSSYHILNARPALQSSTFTGRLELYTYSYDSMECTFPKSFKLCPDSCEQAVVSLGNMGSAVFTGTINYAIKNSASQTVASGSFTITNTTQYDADTVCLFPGKYTLHLTQNNLTPGGQKMFSITHDSKTYPAPFWVHQQSTDTSFSFSFYNKCSLPSAIRNTSKKETVLNAFAANGQLHLATDKQIHIGKVEVYATDGRCVLRTQVSADRYDCDVSHLSPGVYVVYAANEYQKMYIGN